MLENCRLVLYASRFYGCHPHTIRGRPEVGARFRPLMLYSMLACGVYCLGAYYADGMIQCIPKGAMIVGCVLQKFDRYTRGLYMVATTVLSCLQHQEFERAVAAARKFDHLTRRRRRGGIEAKPANRRKQWLTLLGLHVAWAVYSVYLKYVALSITWTTIAIQSATRCAFSVQVAKFCFLYDALRRRFRLVNQLYRGSSDTPAPSIVQRVVVAAAGKRGSNHRVRSMYAN